MVIFSIAACVLLLPVFEVKRSVQWENELMKVDICSCSVLHLSWREGRGGLGNSAVIVFQWSHRSFFYSGVTHPGTITRAFLICVRHVVMANIIFSTGLHFLPGPWKRRLITNAWLSGSNPPIAPPLKGDLGRGHISTLRKAAALAMFILPPVWKFSLSRTAQSQIREMLSRYFSPCLLWGFSCHSSLRLCDVISCEWTATRITLYSLRTSAAITSCRLSINVHQNVIHYLIQAVYLLVGDMLM